MIEITDEMVLAAINAERREQYRLWGRVDPETGEVLWRDRTRLDEFDPSVPKKIRAALSAALAVETPECTCMSRGNLCWTCVDTIGWDPEEDCPSCPVHAGTNPYKETPNE